MNQPAPSDETLERYHRALKAYREGLQDEAYHLLTAVVAEVPFSDAYEALSVILYNQKRYDDAITLIHSWIQSHPDSVMARTNLSRCYVAKGMIFEAEREQAEARRLGWKAELKAKKQEMPRQDADERIARYKKVIDLDPADVLGYYSLGTACLESGKKREALEAFEKAVEVDPTHSSSFLGLGMTLESLGDFRKAADVYRRGTRAADAKGDLAPLRKMEARLREIETEKKG